METVVHLRPEHFRYDYGSHGKRMAPLLSLKISRRIVLATTLRGYAGTSFRTPSIIGIH